MTLSATLRELARYQKAAAPDEVAWVMANTDFVALAAEVERQTDALQTIAQLTGDMPAAYNDEAGWYRGRFYTAVGTAARALAAAERQEEET